MLESLTFPLSPAELDFIVCEIVVVVYSQLLHFKVQSFKAGNISIEDKQYNIVGIPENLLHLLIMLNLKKKKN